jgi:uncharacterized membrane protein
MKLVTVEVFYVIIGLIFAAVAWRVARDATHPKRWGSALFWGLLAFIYLFGKTLPPLAVGYLVLAMVLLAASKQVRKSAETGTSPAERKASAAKLKNKLFWPALLVPGTAVVGSLLFDKIHWRDFWLLDPKYVTLISLGLGALLAIGVAMRLTRENPAVPAREGGRLLQAIGWALILPQMLAALGGIFAQAGVDKVVAQLASDLLPTHLPFVAAAAYCVSMALFTMCMGNAFAAFAAITGGIGLPLIVREHHGNPAIMAALGMLSGYCGTLMTPMAANFNIVPAMLLELKDKNAVVKAQVPIGLAVLAGNILLMYLLVYRF